MRQPAWASRVWLAATLPLYAQDVFLEHWNDLVARQPQGVQFTIAAPKTAFYAGEIIPVELKFTAAEPRTFVALSMPSMEQFAADPAALVDLRRTSRMIDGLVGLKVLSDAPLSVAVTLNEEMRFREPGTYRVYATSGRVHRIDQAAAKDQDFRLYARGTPVELVSNILTLEIRPAPPAWVGSQIADAKKALDAASDGGERLRATRLLRFLDGPEAASELARRLSSGQSVDENEAWNAVVESPYRRQLLPVLEQMLALPGRAVTYRDLDMLARMALEDKATGHPGQIDVRRNEYAARLAALTPAKEPEARTISLDTAIGLGAQMHPEPAWLAGAAAALAGDFRDLPPYEQANLLDRSWNVLKGPAMIPALRAIVANPPPQQSIPPADALAMRRLYELAPEEARQIVLDGIRHPTRRLPFAALAILPDDSLPELNETLAARSDPLLILRYATGDIVKRVESAYLARNAELDRRKLPHCAGPLVFYFLKYDPPFGERLLRQDFDSTGAPPVCYDIGFQFRQLGRWAYSPALERLAIEYLASPKVPVKRGAAEVLGRYGSAAAEKPLWDAMGYFHSWWEGRERELTEKNGEESIGLERALRTALAQANGWALAGPDLQRLLALCSSQSCRQDVTGWIEERRLGSGKSLPHPGLREVTQH